MVLPHPLDTCYYSIHALHSTYSPSFESTGVGSVTRVLKVQIQRFYDFESLEIARLDGMLNSGMGHNFPSPWSFPENTLLILTHFLKGLSLNFQKIIKLTLLDQRN